MMALDDVMPAPSPKRAVSEAQCKEAARNIVDLIADYGLNYGAAVHTLEMAGELLVQNSYE